MENILILYGLKKKDFRLDFCVFIKLAPYVCVCMCYDYYLYFLLFFLPTYARVNEDFYNGWPTSVIHDVNYLSVYAIACWKIKIRFSK